MRVTSTLLAASLLSLPFAARAEDAAKADPFRPVQPAWPEGWSGESPPPASTEEKPIAPAEDNEVFTFDSEPQPEPVVAEQPAATPLEAAPVEEKPAATPLPKEPAREADLHTPHLWMATGGIVLGVSAVAALALGIAFDEPELAGATLGLGGALGITGLTVGVVMQNQRLEAAGHEVAPALPTGIALKVALTR